MVSIFISNRDKTNQVFNTSRKLSVSIPIHLNADDVVTASKGHANQTNLDLLDQTIQKEKFGVMPFNYFIKEIFFSSITNTINGNYFRYNTGPVIWNV